MNAVKGGTASSGICESISVVASVVAAATAVYEVGKNESVWNCPPAATESREVVWYTSVGACQLPEVVVRGI